MAQLWEVVGGVDKGSHCWGGGGTDTRLPFSDIEELREHITRSSKWKGQL